MFSFGFRMLKLLMTSAVTILIHIRDTPTIGLTGKTMIKKMESERLIKHNINMMDN